LYEGTLVSSEGEKACLVFGFLVVGRAGRTLALQKLDVTRFLGEGSDVKLSLKSLEFREPELSEPEGEVLSRALSRARKEPT